MIAGIGILLLSTLVGAVLAVAAIVGIGLLVSVVIDWHVDRKAGWSRVSFRTKARHVKGEPTVRIPIAPIGGAS